MTRLLAIVLSAIALMGLLAWSLTPRGEPPVSAAPVASPSARSDPADDEALLLRRDASGQFHLTAQVNGSDTRFLVDTGADLVALTEAEAEALGILPPPDAFQPMMQTASGVGYGAPVTLDELTIGESSFQSVDAVVVQGLETNLLGQSVLRKLGKVELQGDRMVIRH